MPRSCPHPRPTLIDNGSLRSERKCMPFDPAWCHECGAFREASATKDPEPWQLPKRQVPADSAHADFGI